MPSGMEIDGSLLAAALVGYQHQRDEIDAKMAEIRRQIGGRGAAITTSTPEVSPQTRVKRTMSAAARKRIGAAQRKRWAAVKQSTQSTGKKRKMSAAGRERIAEATRKRWAEFRAKKAVS